jgi:hypothetical protein
MFRDLINVSDAQDRPQFVNRMGHIDEIAFTIILLSGEKQDIAHIPWECRNQIESSGCVRIVDGGMRSKTRPSADFAASILRLPLE